MTYTMNQIRQFKEEQQKKNQLLIDVGDLKKRLAIYRENFKPLEIREVIDMISEIAKSNNIEISSLRPANIQSKDKDSKARVYDKAYFTLSIQAGSYNMLGKFISDLENSSAMFNIQSMGISGLQDSQGLGHLKGLKVEMQISAIFFKI